MKSFDANVMSLPYLLVRKSLDSTQHDGVFIVDGKICGRLTVDYKLAKILSTKSDAEATTRAPRATETKILTEKKNAVDRGLKVEEVKGKGGGQG